MLIFFTLLQCKLRMERDREMIELQRKIQNCPVSIHYSDLSMQYTEIFSAVKIENSVKEKFSYFCLKHCLGVHIPMIYVLDQE